MEIGPTIGTQLDGTQVTNFLTQAGRVVIIGTQPLLEGMLSSNGLMTATLYGDIGANYALIATTNLTPPITWSTQQQVRLTNSFQRLTPLIATNGSVFLRAIK